MALTEPTKPQTSYFLWLTATRSELEKEAGTKHGPSISKLAGEKWKTLSEAAKKPFEEKAVAAKAAYAKALDEFKAAGGVPGQRRQEKKDAKNARADKKAKKEERKNSGKPKRPPSAFWLWQVENRDALVKEAGTNKIPVIGKLAGEKWGKLDAGSKSTYEKKAATLKAEHEKAMAEWKANNADAKDEEEDEEDEQEEESKPESPAKKPRKEEKSETKVAAKAKASPKAKGKAKAKAAEEPKEQIDPQVLKSAQGLGLESALKNLASREELKGKSAASMLAALQSAGGLVNKAKMALLAGA